jgi:hypothetical protein
MKRIVTVDELINSIIEVLFQAEGEKIKEVAEIIGLSGIKYEGDSVFSIEE